MPGTALDTVVTAETPEEILLELRPAGLSARFYAFLVDWLLRLALIYAAVLGMGFLQLGGLGTAILIILMFALEWFYPVLLRARSLRGLAGQTHVRTARGDG